MRICIIQDYLRGGGTERQTLFLAGFFQRSGHETVLLNFRPGGRLAGIAPGGARRVVLQPFDTGMPLFAPGLTRAVRKINPEAILCMGRTANCFAGFIQRRFPAVPVIATVRTGKPLFPLHRRSLRRASSIAVNCEWWRRRLETAGIPPGKIHVIANALLREGKQEDTAARERLRRKHGAGNRTCVFLNAAEFRPGKRQADLLRSFALYREKNPDARWQLWLLGEGSLHKRCQRLAKRLDISDQVAFHGYADDPSPYYSGADVAVSASAEDALPNFLIEAQAAGLPAVAADAGGAGEAFLPERSGYLVPPGDEAAFARALQKTAADDGARRQMSAAARQNARERFDPKRQGGEMLRLLEQMAGRRA